MKRGRKSYLDRGNRICENLETRRIVSTRTERTCNWNMDREGGSWSVGMLITTRPYRGIMAILGTLPLFIEEWGNIKRFCGARDEKHDQFCFLKMNE